MGEQESNMAVGRALQGGMETEGIWGKNGQGTFRTKIPSIAIGILAMFYSCNPSLFPETFMSAILLLHDGGIVGKGGLGAKAASSGVCGTEKGQHTQR